MKYIIGLFIVTLLISCHKVIDDVDVNCSTNCTVIEGRFFSLNNEPIKDIKVSIDHRNTIGHSVTVRKIKEATTDENGYYRMEFYLNDDEIGEGADGHFRMYVEASNIDNEKYINISDIGGLGQAIYSINRRDTVINKSYYVPRKELIKVNLNNYNPPHSSDHFIVKSFFPAGLINCDYLHTGTNICRDGSRSYFAEEGNNEFFIPAAKGQECIIRVSKLKNDTVIPINDTTFNLLEQDSNIELTYNY